MTDTIKRLGAGLVLLAVLLAASVTPACSGGFLTGDQLPDRYAKIYHFKGRVTVDGGSAIVSGNAMGDLESCGVVAFGPIPDAAIVNLSETAEMQCPGVLGAPGAAGEL